MSVAQSCQGNIDETEELEDGGFIVIVSAPDSSVLSAADSGVNVVVDAGRKVDAGFDAGMKVDAGFDAGTRIDAGFDAGVKVDAGVVPVTAGKKCNLHLHWASGTGRPDSINLEGVTEVWPTSPTGAFWLYDGPHNFAYDPTTGEAEYQAIVTFLRGVITQRQCGPTVVIGYSNGGGLAAKLFCNGETFGGRVWGSIVVDPVMDDGVRGCAPSPLVRKVLFTHSDELKASAASANHSCSVTSWYCEDNRTMPVSEYETVIGRTSFRASQYHNASMGWSDPALAPWSVQAQWWLNDF